MHIKPKKPNIVYFICSVILLGLTTVFFRINDGYWDKAIVNVCYNDQVNLRDRFGWGDLEPWRALREMDVTFTVIFLCIIGVMIAIGWFIKRYRPFIKYGLFGLTSFLIGPTLIVNAVLKSVWGRPRPREVFLWPDSPTSSMLPFYRVGDPAFLDGIFRHSFPSGHVSAVIIFIVFYYIFLRPVVVAQLVGGAQPWKVRSFYGMKYFGFIVTFAGGCMMGMTRMFQGAHFITDVIWSYAIVHMVTWWLYYYVFKIPEWEAKQLQQ